MKKLTIIFSLFFLFLFAFPLAINQFNHHSLAASASETKTADQLAQEAWEFKQKGATADGKEWEISYPLQLHNTWLYVLRRIGINGINPENDNLLETVKEVLPFKTYVQLPEKVKAELKNLVKIPGWAIILRSLFSKTRLTWRKKFWDKLRKKYFSYLKKYEISAINLIDDQVYNFFTFISSIPGIASLSFEKLSSKQIAIVPSIYHNGWEFSLRKAINAAALARDDEIPFVDSKTFLENTFYSTYLADLKKYQLKEIGGVEIASLLTLTSESKFVDFTFPQQEQIHNLVDLANYQTLLTRAINQRKQAEVFWTSSANRKEFKQLLDYKLSTIDTVNLDQFTSDDLAKAFTDLTNQQQEQLSQLINLENYASKITTLLSEEEQAKNFWASAINKKLLTTLFQTSLTMLGEVKIDQLNKDLLIKDYLVLTSEEKEQVRSLSKLTNFSQAVQQAVVKTKVKEKTNQLPLILGLSIGLSSLLLVILFSYLYWKKQQKKTSKNLNK